MSKYDPLWKHVADRGEASFKLSYEEIEEIVEHRNSCGINGCK